MTSPTGLSNSQGVLISLPLYQENSQEVQTDQIFQTIFTMPNADRQASDRVRSNEQEKNTSKIAKISRKRAQNDDVVTKSAFKKFRK
jgi:hypothetical protein